QHVQAADDSEEERARGSGSFDHHVPDQSPANFSMLDALLMTSHSTDFLPLFTNTSHPGADSEDDHDDDMEHSSAMTAASTPPPPLLRSRSSASFSSAALSAPLSPLGFDIDRAVGQVEALQLAPPDTSSSSSSNNNIKDNEDRHTRTESHHQYHCEAPSHAKGKGDAPKAKEASRRGVAAPLVNTRIFGEQTEDKMQLVWELVAPFLTVSDVGRLGRLNMRWTELVATWPLRFDTFWPPRTARDIVHDMKRIKRSLSGIRLLQGLDTEIFQVVKPSRLVFLHISGIGMERKPSAALEKLDLSAFDRLEELRLDDLFVFSSLDAIAPCATTLRSLCLRRCTELADLSGFKTMDFAQLRSLEIRDCRLVNRCDSISSLSRLQSLSLSGLSRVKDIVADIKGCTLLTHLSISRCSEMRSVEGLHAFPALTRLELTHNPSLRALPSELPFSCPLLAQLDVSSCPGLQVLPSLAPAKHLELLIVSNTRIRDLECVRAATSLRRIDAAFCFRLVSIAALTTLKDLRCISLRFCQELRNATALAYCRHLEVERTRALLKSGTARPRSQRLGVRVECKHSGHVRKGTMSSRVVTVVFQKGGLGDTGRHAVAHALRQEGENLQVRVVARDPDMLKEILTDGEFASPRLTKIKADPASDVEALEGAIQGADAVVSTLGNRQYGFERFSARATANVLSTMQRNGVERLVCISSVGINEDWPPFVWYTPIRILFSAMLLTVLRSAYRDLSQMETKIRAAGDKVDFLIVRPCGLGPEVVPVGSWKLRMSPEDGPLDDQVAKADVGQFLLQEALHPTIHKTAVTIGQPRPE
ncbi:Tsukushin, partial [Hondaea fermentalgiana]